jgi:YfiH family protein
MVIRSAKLSSVAHGFSLRTGGVSTGRYASLNLGTKWGDEPAHVAENRRRFAVAGGFSAEELFVARQVHGAAVAVVRPGARPSDVAAVEADALVSDVPGVALGVLTADCVPILMYDDAGRAAAIHAGWRGTVADVVGRAVEALRSLGADPAGLRAAIGPSICVRCFEVGEEVAARFEATCVDRAGRKPHVDLRLANRARLVAAGLAEHNIDWAPPCTMCEPARFFSFRRDGGEIGQHLSVVVAGTP